MHIQWIYSPDSLQGLDSQLSQYAHLRTLDLSYNRLESMPPALPRSLWDIRAVGNHLRSLEKNDTAYHWNLKVLDLSDNELERVVFINNTLPSLQAVNLSHNRFWTVPTNMPHNLESIDLSHNFLVQILPGSLDRLPRLVKFYLHANRFSWLSGGIFDKMTRLEVMTLGDNPWACEEDENITRLLRWTEHTRATVLGCPCYTRPICGQSHLATAGREGHSALLTESPLLWVNSRGDGHEGKLPARTPAGTSSYQVKSSHLQTNMYQDKTEVNESGEYVAFVWTSTRFDSFSTHTSTTEDPLSTKSKVVNSPNKSQTLQGQNTVTLAILVLTTTFNNWASGGSWYMTCTVHTNKNVWIYDSKPIVNCL